MIPLKSTKNDIIKMSKYFSTSRILRVIVKSSDCLIIGTVERNSVTWFLGGGDTAVARVGSIAIETLSQLTYGPTTLPQTLRSVICVMCGSTLTSTFFHLTTNHRQSKMNRNIALATAAILILALSTVYAEIVHWTPCPPTRKYPALF